MNLETIKNAYKNNAFISIGYFIAALSFFTFLIMISATGENTSSAHTVFDNSPVVSSDSFKRITVISAGDVMSHMQITRSSYIDSSDCYDYTPIFQHVTKYLEQGDLNIVNFETTNGGKPYSGFPLFSSPDTIAYNLKQIGFNFLVYANNHAVDKGLKGLNRTLDIFDKAGIPHTGVFRNQEERDKNYPYIFNIKGLKIAILNYSYSSNGNLIPKPAVLNMIDTLQMTVDLKAARELKADAIVVCMHWGVEYQRLPNYEQEAYADFLFRNGTDAIIGSHPHAVQPIEFRRFTYNNKPKQGLIIWSLGNYIAHQRKRYSDGGLMVKFDIAKNKYTGEVKIDRVYYLPVWVYKKLNPVNFKILPVPDFNNDTFMNTMKPEDKTAFTTFINDVEPHLATDTARIKPWLP